MDYHVFLAGLAIAIGLIGMIPYIYYLLKDKTKPHIFSWVLWALLSGVAFFASLFNGGGAGAWSTGVISGLCFIVAFIGLFKGGNTYIKKIDWICLFAAIFGVLLWIITNTPLTAVVIVSLTDAVAFIPTFRKGYHLPYEETLSVYLTGAFQNIFGIIALESLSLTTALYPASLVITNTSFLILLLVRRSIKGTR